MFRDFLLQIKNHKTNNTYSDLEGNLSLYSLANSMDKTVYLCIKT